MALNDCTLVFGAGINPKQGMWCTYPMVAGWFGPILSQGTTKECMMVLELFLSRKSESNNSIGMEGDFNVLLMWCHFVKRDKWKNILHTLMQSCPLFPSGLTWWCDRSAMWDYKNITRTRSLHLVASISFRDVTLLKLGDLACFCPKCMADNLDLCENKVHVEPWKLNSLEPINLT